MHENSAAFLAESARYLRDVYLARLERAAEALPETDLWWQPHGGCLSFGNVLLHLEGNVRQWLVSGLGGAPDQRDRATEFATTDGPGVDALLARLRSTIDAAVAVLETLDDEALARSYCIQGFDTSGSHAVYHVVEHFSWHTGQAVWIAKARGGPDHGLAFYDDAKINARRND